MREHVFRPRGVCAEKMVIRLEGGVIVSVDVEGGCDGNSEGLSRLAANRPAREIIGLLRGVRCGDRRTSCPDQLAKGLAKALRGSGDRPG